MKKILVAGITVAAFCSAPALAADMPVKAPYVAPMFNWTGFYLGIEGGDGWGSTNHTNTLNGGSPGPARISGALFGGTYGYNWQSGNFVLGLEGDISWSSIKKTFVDPTGGFCFAGVECFTKLRWLGTDRARIGYAWDRTLVYATVGFAYGDVSAGIITDPNNGSKLRTGWTWGGGLEWAFAPNWSAKLEYLFVDLGEKPIYRSPGGTPENVLVNSNIVRVGLNYKFGDPWGKSPVVAKY
jgi:outer membrane immunogenic protein